MTIAWVYLDKKSAAINALKDYADMEYIIQHTPFDVADARDKMSVVRSATISDMPKHTPNPHAGEERIAAAIDEIDVLKERYRRALEYMEWFRPAWEQLGEDEQFLLRQFFCLEISKTDAVCNIYDKLYIERSQAYNRKEKAVAHLALLLYGK